MPTNSDNGYSITCAQLSRAISDCAAKIQISQKNEALRASTEEKLNRNKRNLYLVKGVMDNVKPCVAEVKKYLSARKRDGLQSINNAIRAAGEIIPNAMGNVHLEIKDNGDAYVASQDNIDMQVLEGGGYRQILSSFIMSTILAANDQYLQTLILDEKYALVNAEYSAELSLYLGVMSQDMQIISIEQKEAVYSNLSYTEYYLSKGDKWTTVTKQFHESEVT